MLQRNIRVKLGREIVKCGGGGAVDNYMCTLLLVPLDTILVIN